MQYKKFKALKERVVIIVKGTALDSAHSRIDKYLKNQTTNKISQDAFLQPNKTSTLSLLLFMTFYALSARGH